MTFLRRLTYLILIGAGVVWVVAALFLLYLSIPVALAWTAFGLALAAVYVYFSYNQVRENAYLVEFELGSVQHVYVSETFRQSEEEYIARNTDLVERGFGVRGLGNSDIVLFFPPFYFGRHYPTDQITLHLDAVEQLTSGAGSIQTNVLIDASLQIRFSPWLPDLIATFGLGSQTRDYAKEIRLPYQAVEQNGTVVERHYDTPCISEFLLRKLREPAHHAIKRIVGGMTFEQIVTNPRDLSGNLLAASADQEVFRQARLLEPDGSKGRSVLMIEYNVERLAFDMTLQQALQSPRLAELAARARATEGAGERQYLEQLGLGEKEYLERVKETGASAEQALASRTIQNAPSNVDIVFSDGGLLGAAGARFLGRGAQGQNQN